MNMLARYGSGVAAALALAAGLAAAADAKPKKPKLDLRATPRMAFSPVNVFFTAELSGGDDVEEYYCPELEWEWDDGGKSTQESDCPPFEAGKTKIERRYTADHEYRRAGVYNVKLTMRRADRSLAAASVRVTVRPGLGDRTLDPNF
jgi:PKD repeat protein